MALMERDRDQMLLSESPRLVKAGGERSAACHSGAGAQKTDWAFLHCLAEFAPAGAKKWDHFSRKPRFREKYFSRSERAGVPRKRAR